MKEYLKITLFSALVLVLFYFWLDMNYFMANVIPTDTLSYIQASNSLIEEGKPHHSRPIGYAVITGIPKLFSENTTNIHYIRFAVVINILAYILSILFFYKALRIYFNAKASFFISAIVMLSFGAIAIVFWMLTESLVIMGISLIGYYLLKYSRNKHNHDLIMASSILNLMVLVKPGFYYPAILGTLTLIVFLMIRGRATRWAFLSIFLLSVGLIILQNTMMYQTYGKAKPSFIGTTTWYHYLGAEAYANAHTMTLDSVKQIRAKQLENEPFTVKNRICGKDFKEQFISHPFIIFKEWVNNVYDNCRNGSNALLLNQRASEKKHVTSSSKVLQKISGYQNTFYSLLFFISIVLICYNLLDFKLISSILAMLIGYVVFTSGISFWQGDRFQIILYQSITLLFMFLIKDSRLVSSWRA